jgi:3-hydroxyacyl-CoA dehydrogenase/enoyl-CoA hydratase/3-hydroxybutyryl-CoA epimerase
VSSLQYFRVKRRAGDVVWLTITIPESEQHEINAAFLYEFIEVLGSIQDKGVSGLILRSARPEVFLTGIQADTLSLLSNEGAKQKAQGFFTLGGQLCQNLQNMSCSTVAIIDGACSGVGIEIMTACDYRILIDKGSTRLSYPEVGYGYHIGFGGLSRLIDQIGFNNTLDFLVASHSYDVETAVRSGLADAVEPLHKAKWLARQWILYPESANELDYQLPQSERILSPSLVVAKSSFNGRLNSASALELNVLDAMIDTWTAYAGEELEAQQEEIKTATALLSSKPTQNKLYIKHLLATLKQEYVQAYPIEQRSIPQHIHIIGSGTIGKHMTKLCVLQGLKVSLYDVRHAALASVPSEMYAFFKSVYPDRPLRIQQALDAIILDVHNAGVKQADIIVEAIQEDKHAKLSLLLEVDKKSKPDACIITSTACLPLDELSQDMVNPERLVGLNMGHPLFNAPCAELIISSCVSAEKLEQAESFAYLIEKTPIPIKSSAGFLSSRLLMAYLTESLMLHQSGISKTDIDQAALAMDMTYPPFELLDELGLEECLRVSEALSDRLGYDIPKLLMQKVEQGLKGKYSGEGFYTYKNGEKQTNILESIRHKLPWRVDEKSIQTRLLERLINESRECLNLGVVEHADLIDLITVVFVGFSASKGGTLSYLDSYKKVAAEQAQAAKIVAKEASKAEAK